MNQTLRIAYHKQNEAHTILEKAKMKFFNAKLEWHTTIDSCGWMKRMWEITIGEGKQKRSLNVNEI